LIIVEKFLKNYKYWLVCTLRWFYFWFAYSQHVFFLNKIKLLLLSDTYWRKVNKNWGSSCDRR